jgi:acetylornithine deacetylase
MSIDRDWKVRLDEYVAQNAGRLLAITSKLVQIPSENTPPFGSEAACQSWLFDQLAQCGLVPDLYTFDQVPGLAQHPLYYAGRFYANRPNLAAKRQGEGQGRSLLLSGHVDTVPKGSQPWTLSPFAGEIQGNRLYGRGANDMKAGIAMNLFAMECLTRLDLRLAGDLVFESVIDEEFGGCNGTLAGRVRGHNADAAILTEASGLRVCPAQRGGRTVHITFRTPPAGVLDAADSFPRGAIPQLNHFLSQLDNFAQLRASTAVPHPLYPTSDPVPVTVTKIFTSPWGFNEPITVPDTVRVEVYWQLMPGETQTDVEDQFMNWLRALVAAKPALFALEPVVEFPIRWLPGSAIAIDEPVVQQLSATAETILGEPPSIVGIEGPCDLFIFHQGFGIPAVIWGPSGGNTHAADEYVTTDSLLLATRTLLHFIVDWCGVSAN